jgi:hypothetical protein
MLTTVRSVAVCLVGHRESVRNIRFTNESIVLFLFD